MTTPDAHGVTIKEASQRLGKSLETIRRWIDEGKIPAWKVMQDGQVVWRVVIDDIMDTDQGMSRSDVQGVHDVQDVLTEKDKEIADLKEEVAALRAQLEEKETEIRDLHALVQEQQKALPSGKRHGWEIWRRT